jgi:hypothetical protein
MARKRTERVSSEYYSADDYAEAAVKQIWRMLANVAAQDKDGTSVELKTYSNGWDIIVWREVELRIQSGSHSKRARIHRCSCLSLLRLPG